MGLETGSFVEDLNASNPVGGDSKSQGDDHLRLIKTVLRGTFKRATKAFSFPGSVSKSANYTVLSTDDRLTILCDTTTQFTLTLPALGVSDAGWEIYVVKTTTDANPVFIAPPSGTINGYSKVRRSVENVATRVMWTGSTYVATRPFGTPVGSSIDFHGSTLPNGHLWADGTTFTAADFVELNTSLGGNTKPDLRGRTSFGRDDMGVGAASRVVGAGSSGFVGTTLGSGGGAETNTLTTAQLPVVTPSGTIGNEASHTHSGTTSAGSAHRHNAYIRDPGHLHGPGQGTSFRTAAGGGGSASPTGTATDSVPANTASATTGVRVNDVTGGAGTDDQTATESAHTHTFTTGAGASHTHSFTGNSFGSGSAHNNMPPGLIVNKILVAE